MRLIRTIRQRKAYKHSTILVVPENNLGFNAGMIGRVVANDRNCVNCVVLTDDPDTAGFRTGKRERFDGSKHLEDVIDRESLFFAKNLVCLEDDNAPNTQNIPRAAAMKRMLYDQLRYEYQYTIEKPGGATEVFISCKFDMKKKVIKGRKDDIVVCLEMLLRIALLVMAESPAVCVDYEWLYNLARTIIPEKEFIQPREMMHRRNGVAFNEEDPDLRELERRLKGKQRAAPHQEEGDDDDDSDYENVFRHNPANKKLKT